jgi:hypothetical protein
MSTKLNDRADSAQQPQQDFLRGARRIGEVIGLDAKAAHNLCSSGALTSIKKIGGRYWASRSRLIREVGGEV